MYPVLAGVTNYATSATDVMVWSGSSPQAALLGRDSGVLANAVPGAVSGHASGQRFTAGVAGYAAGPDTVGVVGHSKDGIGGSFSGKVANLKLVPTAASPIYSSTPHSVGEVVVDSGGNLWFCTGNGTPGDWRLLANSYTTGAMMPMPTGPARVYDSRPGYQPGTGPKTKLTDGEIRTVSLGVASSVSAALVNVTVVDTSSGGWIAVFPGGSIWPGNSTVNWYQPGSVVANMALTKISGGTIGLRCAGSTNVIIDVVAVY